MNSDNCSARRFSATQKLALLQIPNKNGHAELVTYDLQSGQLVTAFSLGESFCNSVPNHKDEFVNGGDHYARIRNLDGRAHTERIQHGNRVSRCTISPDGRIVATAGWQDVRLTERTESRELFRESGDSKPAFAILPHQSRISHLVFSNDNRMLATVQFDGLVRVWDTVSAMSPKFDLHIEENGNQGAFVAEPLQCILTGNHHQNGSVKNLRSIDIASGAIHEIVGDLDGQLRATGVANDGNQMILAIATDEQRSDVVRIYNHVAENSSNAGSDSRANNLSRQWTSSDIAIDLPGDPRAIACHPTDHQYAVLCGNGETVVIDGDAGKVVRRFNVPESAFRGSRLLWQNGLIVWSDDGKSIVLTGNVSPSGCVGFRCPNRRESFSTLCKSRASRTEF